MIKSARTETSTRYFAESGDAVAERVTTETRYAFSGKGHFSLTASCVEFADPYGEADRQILTVWLDGDEISCAVVDWLAALRNTANDDSSPRLQAIAAERLSRFAGAMGLTYELPAPAAAADF
jgi:hypothetical protein